LDSKRFSSPENENALEMEHFEFVKKFGFRGYHEIFKNKKPQINADERGFVIRYLRLFAFICGFIDSKKHPQILHPTTALRK